MLPACWSRFLLSAVAVMSLTQATRDQILSVAWRRAQLRGDLRNAVPLQIPQAQRQLASRADASERLSRCQLIRQRIADSRQLRVWLIHDVRRQRNIACSLAPVLLARIEHRTNQPGPDITHRLCLQEVG